MSDRFKFRVWDTEINEYLVGCFLVGGGNMIHDSVDYESFLNKGNFVIEQCTGLKDKNGSLIYEGDIVKCDRDFDPDGRVNLAKEVIFTDGNFTLANLDPKNRDFCYINRFHNIEIIGNTHESSKLWIHYELEQKDKQ